MEAFIIPGIFLVLTLIFGVIWILFGDDIYSLWFLPTIILAALVLITVIACPLTRMGSKDLALQAETYWEQMIEPNILEEYPDYVVITNPEAAIWQAGGINGYNNYLTTTEYWDHFPILGSCTYPVPDHLKHVRVVQQ